MRARLIILCKSDLATGFRLAGIDAAAVENSATLETIVLGKLRQSANEVVIIDDDFKAELAQDVKERILESFIPLFVFLPLSSKRGQQDLKRYVHEYVSKMIQGAIGKKLAIPM